MKRRSFVVTTAVMATLPNRPAWAQTVSPECVSAAGWASISANMSLNPGEEEFLIQAQLKGVEEVDGNVCLKQDEQPSTFGLDRGNDRSKLIRQRDWLL